MTTAPRARLPVPDLHGSTGHLLRRALQLHNALWAERVSATLTSPQYAVLMALYQREGADQRSVSEWVALDKSTGGDVIGRLVGRGLIRRCRDERDRRRNLLALTAEGQCTLEELTPKVNAFSEYLVAGLSKDERDALTELLAKLVF